MNKKRIIEFICLVGIVGVFGVLLWVSPLVAGIMLGMSMYCLLLILKLNWIENIAIYVHKTILHDIRIRRSHDIACLTASCIFLITYTFAVTFSNLPTINVFVLTAVTTFVSATTSIMANCMYSIQNKSNN